MIKTLNAEDFGELLKKLRTSKKVTLVELGKKISYSNSYLSQIENGKKGIPSHDLITKIASALNVSQVKLLERAGYDLSEFYEEQGHMQNEQMQYYEYLRIEYPDILDILNSKQNVYYNKKSLSKENREKAINILNVLFEDLEVDYPSEDEIEKEISFFKNISNVANKEALKNSLEKESEERYKSK